MKRRAELHAGGLAEVLQRLLVFVSESDATLEVKPAERGRPSAGYIASIVSAGGGAHITSVGGTPELALCELFRMAITEPGHVQAVQPRSALTPEQLGCYHRAGDQTIGCSNPRCPGRVATLGKVCASRDHVEDIERPGHCLWCRHSIERIRVTAGDDVGGFAWRVVPVAAESREPWPIGNCPVCEDERTCPRCR